MFLVVRRAVLQRFGCVAFLCLLYDLSQNRLAARAVGGQKTPAKCLLRMLRDIEHLHGNQRNEPLLWNSRVLHILAPLLAHLFVIRIRRDLRLIGGGVGVPPVRILTKPVFVEEGVLAEKIDPARMAITPTAGRPLPRRARCGALR